MKRNVLLIVLAAALAGAAQPAPVDAAVIAETVGLGAPIASLPCEISQPGFYYLTKNLSTTASDPAITIKGSSVTLDLMGFTLTGPGPGGGTGVAVWADLKNVEVRNGQIKNFYWGLATVWSGSNHRLANLKISGCRFGMSCAAQNSVITQCQALGNYRGIETGAMGAVLDKNTATGNEEYGFIAQDAQGIVTNNVAVGNGYGFWLGGSSFQLVDRNVSVQNIHWNWYNLSGCKVGLNTP